MLKKSYYKNKTTEHKNKTTQHKNKTTTTKSANEGIKIVTSVHCNSSEIKSYAANHRKERQRGKLRENY